MKKYLIVCFCICFILMGCSRRKTEKDAESLYRQAISAIGSHKYDDAESLIRRSISIESDTKRDSALAEDYLLLGSLQEQTGQYDSAAPAYQQAISLAHAIGEKNLERKGKLALAEFFLHMHQFQQAAVNASDAATLSGWLADWDNAFLANEIVRAAQHSMGRYPEEEQILDTLEHINLIWLNRMKEPALFQARFELLQSWNRPDEAGLFYNGWKQTAISRGDTLSLIHAFIGWGDLRQSQHQPDSALRAYTQALSLLNFYENDRLRIEVLSSIGNLSMKTGKINDASRYYNDALERVRRMNNLPLTEILSLQTIACQWLAHLAAARDSTTYDVGCDKIIQSFADSGCMIGEAYAKFLKGRILENRGQLLPALRNYRQALELYERTSVLSEPGTITSLIEAFMHEERTGWHDAPLSILCSVGNAAEAFELEERSNIKELNDFFMQLPVNSKYSPCNPEIASLQWRRRAYAMLHREIMRELEGGTGRNLERLQKLHEQDSLWSVASDTQVEKSQLPEQYRWLFRPGLLSTKQIQDTLSGDDAVVAYIPLAKTLYSITVRHDTSIIRKSNVDRGYLTSLINEYNALLGTTDTGTSNSAGQGSVGRINSLSAILFSHFISPVQPLINPGNRVYVIQTGRIGWFPVHTLRGDGGTFAGKYRVRYLPGSAALLFPRQPVKRSDLIAGIGHAGNTGWDVEYELKDIRAFAKDAKMFFDTSATLAHLRSGQYDVLHICSELKVTPAIPGLSEFTLSDGMTIAGIHEVSVGEIFSFPSWQSLVFSNISAIPGGMARYVPAAFLVNGTSNVVGSMWQGDHKTKKYFGEIFYTGLMNGLHADDAYDQAVRKLSSDREYASPRQWGLYYLFGK